MTNVTSNGTAHGEANDSEPTAILFIFVSCMMGALIRTVLKKVRLPYTVVLLLFGCLIGVLSSYVPMVANYTTLTELDPHTILNIFLPILIFESAFAMEIHMFMKSGIQIVILAIPGLCLTTFLTCLFGMFVFSYGWSWYHGMMFGAIVSATDPVAVVALLRDLGTSKQLATIIEGESLLNDGAAIVIFKVFLLLAEPGSTFGGVEIAKYFFQVVFGGPSFGLLMGKLTTLWLVNIYNDALTEITITLCSTYVTFYIAEVWCDISGVLAVVVLGLVVSSERTTISPEVEAFLHRFWEMLSYLANTLIFILVGVVITERAIQHAHLEDFFLLGALYCYVFVIRAIMLLVFSPLLGRLGYGMTWRSAAVMTWGGLRGAVGLAMALILLQHGTVDPTGNMQNKVLIHAAGLVILTLFVNATTLEPLLKVLGMNDISVPKRVAMASAVRNLKEVAQTSLTSYKTDRFLADADWDVVMRYTEISDPYHTVEEEAELDDLTNFNRMSKCPECSTHVPNEPSQAEWKEMENEARLRLLKAEKVSYWRQFEHGMLSREAVGRLLEQVDNASDSHDGAISITEIKKNWEIKGIYAFMKKRFQLWQHQKPDQEAIIWPENKACRTALKICIHPAFDIVLYVIILLNVVFVIYEVVVEVKLCPDDIQAIYGDMFAYLNYIFIIIYIVEFIIKIVAYQVGYFRDKWNLFDFIILLLSIAEMILDLCMEANADPGVDSCDPDTGAQFSAYFNAGVLKIAKSVRLLRLLRSLRLVKGLIPQVIDFLNHQINKKLRLGYDVGKGYITGEEDLLNHLDIMVDNKKIARETKEDCNNKRLIIMKELGQLQKNHPGIAVSIKTQQAARRILNNIRDRITKLRGEGVLDEMEAHKLVMMVEMKMKMLQKIPATIHPPPAEKIIYNLSWVAGDPYLMDYIKANAQLVTMQEGEELDVESDPKAGIYVVISGLIKVDKFVEDYTLVGDVKQHKLLYQANDNALDFDRMKQVTGTIEKVSDYLSTGSVLGEWALLTGRAGNTIIRCDTSLQMYHISYEAIQSALELFTDPPSLEYRLWRVAALRVALPIIKKLKFFRTWGSDRIKTHMEKCVLVMKKWHLLEGSRSLQPFVFDLRALLMSDVVLVYGYAQDPDTGLLYQGPCCLPSHLNLIHLLPGRTEKHILIILSRDTTFQLDEDEITGEIEDPHNALKSAMNKAQNVSSGHLAKESSMCLLHSAHHRHELEERAIEHRDAVAHHDTNAIVRKMSSFVSRRPSNNSSLKSGSLNLESGVIPQHRNDTNAETTNSNNSAKAPDGQKVGFRPGPLPPLILNPIVSSKVEPMPLPTTTIQLTPAQTAPEDEQVKWLTSKPPPKPPRASKSPLKDIPPMPKRQLTPVED